MAGSTFTGPIKIRKSDGTKVTFVDADGQLTGDIKDTLADGQMYIGDATNTAAEVTMSGDATISNAGVLTIAADAVEESMVEDSAGAGGLFVKKSALVTYDFAVDGGAQGTIVPTGSPTLPDNAVIRVVSYDVITTFTSATDAATIALNLPVDGDLVIGVAISNGFNPWDAGVFDGSDGALANKAIKKTTASRVPQIVVAGGEDVTAGKVVFELEWWVSA